MEVLQDERWIQAMNRIVVCTYLFLKKKFFFLRNTCVHFVFT